MAGRCLTAAAGADLTGPLGWGLALAIVVVTLAVPFASLDVVLRLTSRRMAWCPAGVFPACRSASRISARTLCLCSVAWRCWRGRGGGASAGRSRVATAASATGSGFRRRGAGAGFGR